MSLLPAGYSVHPPLLLQSSLEFPFSLEQTQRHHQVRQGRISPCGAGGNNTLTLLGNFPDSTPTLCVCVRVCVTAISWCNVTEQPLDVTANGYRHGVTKKDMGTAKARWRSTEPLTMTSTDFCGSHIDSVSSVSRSRLCKLEIFHSFLSLLSASEPSSLPESLR